MASDTAWHPTQRPTACEHQPAPLAAGHVQPAGGALSLACPSSRPPLLPWTPAHPFPGQCRAAARWPLADARHERTRFSEAQAAVLLPGCFQTLRTSRLWAHSDISSRPRVYLACRTRPACAAIICLLCARSQCLLCARSQRMQVQPQQPGYTAASVCASDSSRGMARGTHAGVHAWL
eukprot:357811-Chlamydomonas_euryale.AAC.17